MRNSTKTVKRAFTVPASYVAWIERYIEDRGMFSNVPDFFLCALRFLNDKFNIEYCGGPGHDLRLYIEKMCERAKLDVCSGCSIQIRIPDGFLTEIFVMCEYAYDGSFDLPLFGNTDNTTVRNFAIYALSEYIIFRTEIDDLEYPYPTPCIYDGEIPHVKDIKCD
ncbi:MAG: hypothetical protein KRP56_03015 [Candidatus Methanogranum gryphiswaldense]|nr:MAG: hypothetical protein KRP56_03015 [Candidatus Methanogranum sp. U3.2.1]